MSQSHYRLNIFISISLVLLSILSMVNIYQSGFTKTENTYVIEEIDDSEEAAQALSQNNQVLHCPGPRSCVLERQIVENGGVPYKGSLQNQERYSIVYLNGSFYIPTRSKNEGTNVLTLERITSRNAVRHIAVPASEFSPQIQNSINKGSITVSNKQIPAFEQGVILKNGDKYYWNRGYRSSDKFQYRKSAAVLILVSISLISLFNILFIVRRLNN